MGSPHSPERWDNRRLIANGRLLSDATSGQTDEQPEYSQVHIYIGSRIGDTGRFPSGSHGRSSNKENSVCDTLWPV